MTKQRTKYEAIQEEDGSWSVIDTATELAVVLAKEPMVLLQERFAKTLAEFLNLEEKTGSNNTLQ
ncbi:hypothetical protein CYG48_14550 [Neorhizobium sp. SOG26]|uniref:Uncharacterized protein n=1 Tax=Neorhizobium turbinariae TaxID=2937795 RepID=A0ABT0IUB3_9HYPH|nr:MULTISPECIES: hypothetical protein [Neorhizobium]AXV16806.1 hypothetical protein CYG48_14550 [Neorhizobium sp. SOG26]MCK8781469.1 hypothetical protein [Neorhizobium turbinariae]